MTTDKASSRMESTDASPELCALCGRVESFDLLDTCRDGEEDQRLICIACYGPGVLGPWEPGRGIGSIARSVRGGFAALYAAYLDQVHDRWMRDLHESRSEVRRLVVSVAQLQAERDDLLRHRAASEAPGWTYQGPHRAAAHLSDAVVAGRVRMLMRYDLDHEAVCVMARDRIRDLSREVARLRALIPGEA